MVKIVSLELENVKRVALVRLEPSASGLTVIGGDNCQGKTSILDGIVYALGGERYRPSNLQREGSHADARIELTLSNGLKVERRGKNATLKVTDPTGAKAGQKLLDSFVEELALNLPKFLAMPSRDKAAVLLRILGIEDQLAALDKAEKAAYDERHAQGRIADQKEKYAAEMPEYHDVPDTPMTPGELVKESQAIMERNAEKANARREVETIRADYAKACADADAAKERLREIEVMLAAAQKREVETRDRCNLAAAKLKEAEAREIPPDESTAEVEAKLSELEAINAKVRSNADKAKALADAEAAREEWGRLSARVDEIREERLALLEGAKMPLPGLSVENGDLTYNGKAWDCMSSAEQMRAGVAIVRALKPECGFVLLDGLERFDTKQLASFGAWLEEQGLQALATRVGKGSECSIVIEDGMVGAATISSPAEPVAVSQGIDW